MLQAADRDETRHGLDSRSGLMPHGVEGFAAGDTKGKGRAKPEGSDVEVEMSLFDFESTTTSTRERRVRSPSADPLLELPGELVLAKEGKLRTQYWPAKLLEFVKPKRPHNKPKYKVLFFDGTIKHIDTDWFYTTTDDEFTKCTVCTEFLSEYEQYLIPQH